MDQSATRAEAILRRDGALSDRLMAMIEECLIGMMRQIAESPHGAEILDMKSTLAGDIVSGWKQRLGGLIATAIEAEARGSGVDLEARGVSAKLLATLLLDGLEGMKSRIRNPEEQRTAARGLVRVVEIAIRA
jgi:hypothetical protein